MVSDHFIILKLFQDDRKKDTKDDKKGTEDTQKETKDDKKKSVASDKTPKADLSLQQSVAVLGIALIAMGEDVGTSMSFRLFGHLVSLFSYYHSSDCLSYRKRIQ